MENEMPIGIFQARKCLLTGRSGSELKYPKRDFNLKLNKGGYHWCYPADETISIIVEGELYRDEDYWETHKVKILYLIENGLWPSSKMVDKRLLEALISSSGIPENPLEKIHEILYYCNKHSGFLGQLFAVREDYIYDTTFKRKIGVDSDDELENLINEAIKKDWIRREGTLADLNIALTLNGWERVKTLIKSTDSNIAFVAMSFDAEMIKVYNNWIEPAIRQSGHQPYLVSDQHPGSDVTINDAILAGIKKAKFTIADFTHHKAGVYFEAGYALGRGQKVIYTCREDHIETAHFDTRNYQHIVWKQGEDLKRKLLNKIEVFIKS